MEKKVSFGKATLKGENGRITEKCHRKDIGRNFVINGAECLVTSLSISLKTKGYSKYDFRSISD